MIKAVIFDVGGVLHTERKLFFRETVTSTLGISDSQFDEFFRPAHLLLSTGKIDENEFWTRLAKSTGQNSKISNESIFEKEFRKYIEPFERTYKIIQQLKKQKLRVAVLSNSIEAHAKVNRERKIYDPFEFLVLSHEVGLRKPDPKIYELTLKKLALRPEETVFVDDLEENIKAARKLGMKGIVFENVGQLVTELKKLKIY